MKHLILAVLMSVVLAAPAMAQQLYSPYSLEEMRKDSQRRLQQIQRKLDRMQRESDRRNNAPAKWLQQEVKPPGAQDKKHCVHQWARDWNLGCW